MATPIGEFSFVASEFLLPNVEFAERAKRQSIAILATFNKFPELDFFLIFVSFYVKAHIGLLLTKVSYYYFSSYICFSRVRDPKMSLAVVGG